MQLNSIWTSNKTPVIATLIITLLVFSTRNIGKKTPDSLGSIRDLKWSSINFLHTTDTHGWYGGHTNQKLYGADWGDFISFTENMRSIANSQNVDLLLVDTGDRHDGNGLTDATVPNGIEALPIFAKQDYDLVTIGNHELYLYENSKQEFDFIVQEYGDNYISSNVEYKNDDGDFEPFGKKYKYFTTPNQKVRILSFAFLFDFTRNNEGTRVTSLEDVIKEKWFLKTLKKHPGKDVDLIVVFGHIPIAHTWKELLVLHQVLREYYPETKIQYFGGHSHIRDFTIFDSNLTGLQSGRYCESVGWVSIDLSATGDLSPQKIFARSYIDFNLNSFLHHSGKSSIEEFETEAGNNVTRTINLVRNKLHLNDVLGHVNRNYYVDYVPLDHPQNLFKLLADQVLPTLKPTEALKNQSDERIFIINTGSIRYDLYKGPYTIDTRYIVSPFENEWARITLPKSIAIRIGPFLNKASYILSQDKDNEIDNRRLLPLHQYSQRLKQEQQLRAKLEEEPEKKFQYPAFSPFFSQDAEFQNEASITRQKLSKGYVTHDDFGDDGDDTPHKPVINFPITNVVESKQLDIETGEDALVDVIYYKFIEGNILWTLKHIGYDEKVESELYSTTYLNQLLEVFIQQNEI